MRSAGIVHRPGIRAVSESPDRAAVNTCPCSEAERGKTVAGTTSASGRSVHCRSFAWLAVLALLVLTLSACSTGDADDANESATKAAEESTNVVADIEATQVVREFFASTEEPTPVPTVMPSLANLRLTESLRSQNEPDDNLYRVRRGTRIYAAAQIANLFPGQRVVALWKDSGQVIATSEVRIENERELVWIPLQWDVPSSLPSGTYSVVIQVIGPGVDADGEEIELTVDVGSLVFEMD
jgi:hypothetical protein